MPRRRPTPPRTATGRWASGRTPPPGQRALTPRPAPPRSVPPSPGFTGEQAEAYHFVGVTDPTAMVALYQAGVTWDLVEAYVLAGVNAHQHNLIRRLHTHDLSPATYAAWRAFADTYTQTVDPDQMLALAAAGATPDQVAAYYEPVPQRPGAVPPGRRFVTVTECLDLLRTRVSPLRASYFQSAGVTGGPAMAYLVDRGVTPRHLFAYRHATAEPVRGGLLLVHVGRLWQVSGHHQGLTATALAAGLTPATVAQWTAAEPNGDRVVWCLRAGISLAEYTSDPTVAEADDATLQTLAALQPDPTTRSG